MAEKSPDTDSPHDAPHCDVFLCYRQIDGRETADWLRGRLHDRPVPSAMDPAPRIRFYVDRYTAAGPDWRRVNRDALRRARAMIVVCTPGAKDDEGPDDEVQKEIRWWIENRRTAPLLVDATGSASRYVPKRIRERWPDAQLVEVRPSELAKLDDAAREVLAARIVDRLAQGIVLSEGGVRDEEQARALRQARVRLAVVSLAFAAAAVAAVAFLRQRDEAERLRRTADLSLVGSRLLGRAATTDEAELGALLVLEALRREPRTLAAQSAWARVLEYCPPFVETPIPSAGRTNAGEVSAFSPDGARLALSEAESGKLRVIELATGRSAFEFGGPESRCTAVAFDPRGHWLAGGDDHGAVRTWEVPGWTELKTLELGEPVQAVAFVDHGRELAVAGVRSKVEIWQVREWKRKPPISDAAGDTLSVVFSPDGQWVVTTSWQSQIEENVVRVRDLASGQQITSHFHCDPYATALSDDGRYLAVNGRFTQGDDRVAQVQLLEVDFDPRSGRLTLPTAETYPIEARGAPLAFDPLARFLAVGGDGAVRVLATRGGRDAAKLDHVGVRRVAFVRDGAALATAGAGRARVWDFSRGRELAERLTIENAPLEGARYDQEIGSLVPAVLARIGRELTAKERAQYVPPDP